MSKIIPLYKFLKLRCTCCGKEKYEIHINTVEGVYTCECGSSTFTPLNLDEI